MSEKATILIVDDDSIARATVEILLARESYTLVFAENGMDGLEKVQRLQPDVVLLDVMMPMMDGFEVCRQIRSMPHLADIPILLISTLDDRDSRLTGLRAGADDFITKPFDALELQTRLASITRLNRFRHIVNQRNELDQLHSELLIAYDKTIEGWTQALDLRDKETEGHTRRVTEMTLLLARKLGIGDEEIPHVWRGAMLHDVGKLGIPDAILLKPGPLDAQEWQTMRKHTQYAFDWLYPIEFLRPALDIPYCHHERWDGSGYPRGLISEEIPLVARIFAMVDVWDAITSERPYHRIMLFDQAYAHMQANAGSHFDPSILPIFLAKLPEFGYSNTLPSSESPSMA